MSRHIFKHIRNIRKSNNIRFPGVSVVVTVVVTFVAWFACATPIFANPYSETSDMDSPAIVQNNYSNQNSSPASDAKLKKYILFTYTNLTSDILHGQGEYLDSLYLLFGISNSENSQKLLNYLRVSIRHQVNSLRFSDAVLQFRNSEQDRR